MTAIAGVTCARTLPYSRDQVRRLLNAQRAFGSESATLTNLGSTTFGISPHRGDSNVTAVADSRVMLVADARLDNRDEIIGRVKARLHHASDCELLLAAWLEAGEDCLSWIAGDFALAVFDNDARTLTLARDPTGQMPLHYAQTREDAAFASMPTGLRPYVEHWELDRAVLAASMFSLREDDPHSSFQQVARVLPGEIVRLGLGDKRRAIYWAPATFYEQPLGTASLVEEYRHVLDQAVASTLKGSTGPIATHLSSGYDSSAVTATAARIVANPSEIVAFTSAPAAASVIPPHHRRIADESSIAAATAASLGVRHEIVREMPPMRTVMRSQFLLSQDLNIGVPNLAWMMQIRKEAAEIGVKRLLNGESGNVTLHTGGLYILSEWIRQGRWWTWARQAMHAARRPDTNYRGVLFNSFLPWLPRAAEEALRKFRFGSVPAHENPFLRAEWRHRMRSSVIEEPKHLNGYQARIYWIRGGNPGMLRKAAVAGEGIEERDPLADRRLIEFSLRLPPEQFYWNGQPRPLARAALADRLPHSVIHLEHRGLQSADWAARFGKSEANEILEEISESSTANDLFHLDRIRNAIERWPTENWNDWPVQHLYRGSVIGALAAGMFALVHEKANGGT